MTYDGLHKVSKVAFHKLQAVDFHIDGKQQLTVPSGYLTVCHGKLQFLRTVNHL